MQKELTDFAPVQQIQAVNIPRAYATGHSLIRQRGVLEQTRNGPAMVLPGPTITSITRPWERVIVDELRDANPFFHLMEAIWMLCGRRDVETLAVFNKRMREFSDDGVNFHAAYGHRWRNHFSPDEFETMDQLEFVINLLRRNPEDRRVVLTMWDPTTDLASSSVDVPCNTQVYFRARRKTQIVPSTIIPGSTCEQETWVLDMTVTNRSNDFFWGLMGANAVHMSIMHEFVAAMSGMQQGAMYTLSNNLHAYVDLFDKIDRADLVQAVHYDSIAVNPHPLFFSPIALNYAQTVQELNWWWRDGIDPTKIKALTHEGAMTIDLMRASFLTWKDGNLSRALELAGEVPADDWRNAAVQWLERRKK